jgi:hypothetical protein
MKVLEYDKKIRSIAQIASTYSATVSMATSASQQGRNTRH